MKTASLRDLRYSFPKIEAWLRAGEEVRITKHRKPLCRIVSERKAVRKRAKPPLPDYTARLTRLWGERIFTQAEIDEARGLETGEP